MLQHGRVGIREPVGDEEIRPAEVDGQRPERLPHGVQALRPVHARVDHQAPVRAPNQVGIDGPQGISGQWDLDPMDVGSDLVDHTGLHSTATLPHPTQKAPRVDCLGRLLRRPIVFEHDVRAAHTDLPILTR
jgi:hypothetical protein